MRISDAQIRGLAAVTESGTRLGTVDGMVIDVDSQSVVQYSVSRSGLLSSLLPGSLIVAASEVVSIDDKRMVVRDESVSEREEAARISMSESQMQTGVSAMGLDKQS